MSRDKRDFAVNPEEQHVNKSFDVNSQLAPQSSGV